MVNVEKESNEVLRGLKRDKQKNAALTTQLEAERKINATF
jgi:hypothetical protein